MSASERTTTEHLADVIHAILRAQQSGTLWIERGDGKFREEGNIFFANGQVIGAQAGARSGSEAFAWLSTWKRCYVRFIPDIQQWSGRDTDAQRRIRDPESGVDWPVIPPPAKRPQDLSDALVRGHTPSPPSRLIDGHQALLRIRQLGLSRMHRHIFLLVDGQRTLYDFSWLTKQAPDEVQRLLNDLERAGLIRL